MSSANGTRKWSGLHGAAWICFMAAFFGASLLSGCAVLQSPGAWGWAPPGEGTPVLTPGELVIGPGNKTVDDVLKAATDYDAMQAAIADTQTAVSKKKTAIRALLDESSGGNYGWGILGAGAAVANLHVSVLKGLALAGGTHLALSNRLSPKDQFAALSDAVARLACVSDVARSNADARAALQRSTSYLASLRSKPAGKTATTFQAFDAQLAPPPALSLDDFRAAIRAILYKANNAVDAVYVNALANTGVGTNLVSSTNTLVAKLKENAAAAKNAADAAERGRQEAARDVGGEQGANAVVDAAKAAAEAQKNAADAEATTAVRLAACQGA